MTLLLSLPPDLADSELALRLKLLVFGELGYRDDFQSILAHLEVKR